MVKSRVTAFMTYSSPGALMCFPYCTDFKLVAVEVICILNICIQLLYKSSKPCRPCRYTEDQHGCDSVAGTEPQCSSLSCDIALINHCSIVIRAERRRCEVTITEENREWSDISEQIHVIHIQLHRLDLERLDYTRVWPIRRSPCVRARERRSNYPANHPKPKTLSRFSANEKPALFSSAHQLTLQDPSVT